MGLKNRDGVDIKDYWKNGIRAYLGTTFAGFPNAFMSYTPYAPTAIVNGTAIIEAQCDFACSAIRKVLESEKAGGRRIKSIEALSEAEDAWARYIEQQNAPTLFPLTDSWWNGANIPGKKPQMLTYLNGMATYDKEINERLDRLEGFDVRYWNDKQDAQGGSKQATGSKLKNGPTAQHVEHVDQGVKGASEAAEILRPTVAAG